MNNVGRGSDNKNQKINGIFTRETAGLVVILFSVITLIILISRRVIFGNFGFAVSSFLLGTFGYCSYAVLAALIYGGIVLLVGKKRSVSHRRTILGVLLFLFLVSLIHTVTAQIGGISYTQGYGQYLAACYQAGENSFFQTTGGGVLIGLIVYPVVKLTTAIGGYIIFSILMIGTAYLMYLTEKWAKNTKDEATVSETVSPSDYATSDTSSLYSLGYADAASQKKDIPFETNYNRNFSKPEETEQPINPTADATERSKRLYALGDEFGFKTKREIRQEQKRDENAKQQNAKLSPYAEGRKILYPDKPKNEDYSWYKERFGVGESDKSEQDLKTSSKKEETAPNGSYTTNGIFNKDSYFNNPNRAELSYRQYANNFKMPNDSTVSKGHELSSSVQPSVPQQQESSNNYSDLYADASENNISYSARPKKIVTDTTHSENERSASEKENNYYRKDVECESPAENINQQPTAYNESSTVQNSAVISGQETTGGETKTDDISEVMRRSGFGTLQSHRQTETAGEIEKPLKNAEERKLSNFNEDGNSDASIGFAARSSQTESKRRMESDISSRSARSESSDDSRRPFLRNTEEETSGLKPIEENLDTVSNLFDDDPKESIVPNAVERIRSERDRSVLDEPIRRRPTEESPSRVSEENKEEPVHQKHIYARYNPPPLNLLREYPPASVDSQEIEENKEIIVETLSCFKIQSEVVRVTQGPSVTRYDIEVPGNIPIQKVLSCDKELAMHLHAKDGVNIQPNYENGAVSIEVPNRHRATVGLKEILQSESFTNTKPGSVVFGLGKDIEGRSVCGDIKKMKHLLVAGATGSGKSICLHALIISLLYRYSPEELRFIFVDPKQVEFNIYDKMPHLMINEIVSDPGKVVTILDWLIAEMERRYSLFKEKTKRGTLVREIDDYNSNLTPDEEKIPKIVLIIDELADLMSVSKKELEDRIQRLTQKSRAAGIHLVLATQRPSVDVITGVIKTNLPTRIALKLTQEVDSRTILDGSGAEKLLGNGDLLYRTDSMNFARRVQGAFVDVDEMQSIAEYIKENNEAYFDDRVSEYINNAKNHVGGDASGDDMQVEAVYIDALRYVVSVGQASISMIQRRCSVGYPKAGKIVEWMENMGYVSEFDGAKARKVLLTQEEFDEKYGDFGD